MFLSALDTALAQAIDDAKVLKVFRLRTLFLAVRHHRTCRRRQLSTYGSRLGYLGGDISEGDALPLLRRLRDEGSQHINQPCLQARHHNSGRPRHAQIDSTLISRVTCRLRTLFLAARHHCTCRRRQLSTYGSRLGYLGGDISEGMLCLFCADSGMKLLVSSSHLVELTRVGRTAIRFVASRRLTSSSGLSAQESVGFLQLEVVGVRERDLVGPDESCPGFELERG
ncbi:hypothetical protein MRX96_057119 [Rhipicephalus microplus]